MTSHIHRSRFVVLGGVALVFLSLANPAGGRDAAGPGTPRHRDAKAPIVGEGARGAIDGRYIVVFEKDAPSAEVDEARRDAKDDGAEVHYRYGKALPGFAATLTSGALEELRRDPRVSYIEADRVFTAAGVQAPAPWALDRLDQRTLPRSHSYTYNATGAGVKVYVIDTGIRKTHSQFGGRVIYGRDTVDGARPAADCNGHGTHVAGSVGGSTYGVAKGVTLVAVRVLNCHGRGTTSGVIAGIDWVTGNHAAGRPAVANMSLGGGASSAVDTAVRSSIADGVTYTVAAGNEDRNACQVSPARVAPAITVGSTTSSDSRSWFSNHGSCLDLFAPGSGVASAWHTSDTATRSLAGTSMASPHVAGVAALYLQNDAAASPQTVSDAIVSSATTGVVTNRGGGSPNRLLYSLFDEEPPPTGSCGLPERYTGTLDGSDDSDDHPDGASFESAAGTHRGCLHGPASGADFDLYLWKWDGAAWVIVARGTTGSADEDVAYTGDAGEYVWEVRSYSGGGSYTFEMQRP